MLTGVTFGQSTKPHTSQTHNKVPRFGWASGFRGHKSIEYLAALNLRPSDKEVAIGRNMQAKPGSPLLSKKYPTPRIPLFQFITQHMGAINHHSAQQDISNKGRDHFLNLETFQPGSHKGLNPNQLNFKRVQSVFSDRSFMRRAQEFETKPLTHEQLHSAPNVYKSIIDNYQALYDLFRSIKVKQPVTADEKKAVTEKIEKAMGQLAHYIGDLHQPMHVTSYHTWETLFPWEDMFMRPSGEPGEPWQAVQDTSKDMHGYFERKTFDEQKYRRMFTDIRRQPMRFPVAVPDTVTPAQAQDVFETLKAAVIQRLQKSHLNLYDLVRIDRDVRNTKPNNPGDYFYRLSTHGFNQRAQDYMREAAEMLAHFYYLAYVTAGSPDIDTLNKRNQPWDNTWFDELIKSGKMPR